MNATTPLSFGIGRIARRWSGLASGIAVWLAVLAVRAYQVLLAPMAGGTCRFTPSCSEYAIEAIERHGAARGIVLAAGRLWRCRPFGSAGLDPVPARRPITLPDR